MQMGHGGPGAAPPEALGFCLLKTILKPLRAFFSFSFELGGFFFPMFWRVKGDFFFLLELEGEFFFFT